MAENVESMGFHDTIEAYHYRNGKLLEKRITGPKTGLKAKWIKFIKALGLGTTWADDLITNVGKATTATDMATRYTYLAVGTDQGSILPLAVGNTALGAESNRAQSTNSTVLTNVSGDTARFEATITFNQDTGVCESAMFDANVVGNMLCRQTFNVLNMKSGDILTLVWKVVAS